MVIGTVMHVSICLYIILFVSSSRSDNHVNNINSVRQLHPWELPVIPPDLAVRKAAFQLYTDNKTHDKFIPRHLWIAVRDINDGLNYQMPALFQRNPQWEIHIVSNDEKDLFMNQTFANTSILWAYHSIHPEAGAAKADIWRYFNAL